MAGHQCSHVNVQQMAAVCKPGGQIILLQHGKATWDWLNSRLDDEAPAHHAKWGCWWNRDILQIVRQVAMLHQLPNAMQVSLADA